MVHVAGEAVIPRGNTPRNKACFRGILCWRIRIEQANNDLVGGWTNPFEKYDSQIWSFPQVGMKKH